MCFTCLGIQYILFLPVLVNYFSNNDTMKIAFLYAQNLSMSHSQFCDFSISVKIPVGYVFYMFKYQINLIFTCFS